MRLFFYELHEGASDLLTDALLVSEREHTPEAFAAMVLTARAAVVPVETSDEFRSLIAEVDLSS